MAQRFFILGCGKMGGALLAGWLAGDKDGSRDFIIIDPYNKSLVLKFFHKLIKGSEFTQAGSAPRSPKI